MNVHEVVVEVIVVAEMIIVMIVEEVGDGAITVVVVVDIEAIEADPVETGVEYTFTPMNRSVNGWKTADVNVGHVNHYLM